MRNSTRSKTVTPENFSSKLRTRDCVGAVTIVQISVQIGSVGDSPQVGEV